MSERTVDVIVIGSGQAGVPLATRFGKLGRRVVLFERGPLGGTCVNDGCTPTKTMIASARAAHVARTCARFGVDAGGVRVDLGRVIDRKNGVVEQWRSGVQRRLSGVEEHVTVVRAHARFVAPRTVEADGARYRAETVIVNTGARPVVPDVPGLATVPFLTSTTALELRELPGHLVVLGGGYIGCELGQMFRRFGAPVTIVDRSAHLLEHEDHDVSEALEGVFRSEGITLALGAGPEGVRRVDGGRVALEVPSGEEIVGTHLLVATGRRPNTDDLGCEAGGVALDARGFVVTDDGYATSAPGTYAVGDVTGSPQFTHTAWDDHRILFDRLTASGARGRSDRLIPFTAFTDPQVAGVGLSEKQARASGVAYEAATMPFGDVARAMEADETAGVIKVLIDPATEHVLGARIVGAEAGELVHVFIALMAAKASVRAVVDAEFVHPAYAEGLQSLVMRLPRFQLS